MNLSAAMLFLMGVLLGAIISFLIRRPEGTQHGEKPSNDPTGSDEESSEADSSDDSDSSEEEDLRMKIIFTIRQTTPKVPPSTVASIVSHSSILLAEKSMRLQSPSSTKAVWKKWYMMWRRSGCAKITLKGSSDNDGMKRIAVSADELKVPVVSVTFGSLHEALSDEIAVVALGPAPSSVLDQLTGSFKLMS